MCRAHNDKVSITGSVKISIQSRPMFTIAIGDKHVDEKTDVTWTCEVHVTLETQSVNCMGIVAALSVCHILLGYLTSYNFYICYCVEWHL